MLNLIDIAHAQTGALNAQDVASGTQDELAKLIASIIAKVPLWITAFIILVLTIVVARIAKAAVENKLTKEGFEEENKEVTILAARATNVTILTLGITVALKIAGIDLTAIIAAGAFGIGFALRDIIMNFIAGVMILSSKHYNIGDIIKVGGVMGKIVEIQTRATIVRTFDGPQVIVPNADIFSKNVTNISSSPLKRVKFKIGVNYGEDLRRVKKVIKEAAKNTKGVMAVPKPTVRLAGWGTYSINIQAKIWVDKKAGWLKVQDKLIQNINDALVANDISIPFPIQTVEKWDSDAREGKLQEDIKNRPKMEALSKAEEGEGPKKLVPAPAMAKTDTEEVAAADWLKKAAEDIPKPTEAPAEPAPEPAAEPAPQQEAPAQPEQPAPVTPAGTQPIPGLTPQAPEQPAAPQNPEQQPPAEPQNPTQ